MIKLGPLEGSFRQKVKIVPTRKASKNKRESIIKLERDFKNKQKRQGKGNKTAKTIIRNNWKDRQKAKRVHQGTQSTSDGFRFVSAVGQSSFKLQTFKLNNYYLVYLQTFICCLFKKADCMFGKVNTY